MVEIRADQIGSLLRPAWLLDARARLSAGSPELREVEDRAITEAVARQLAIGLPVVVDGEFRRSVFWLDFIAGIDGLVVVDGDERAAFSAAPGSAAYVPKGTRAVAKIRPGESQLAGDYRFLADAIAAHHPAGSPGPGVIGKITLPSPTRAHVLNGREAASRDVYPDMDDYWNDLIAVYRTEIARLEELGCRYIQIDEPYFSSFVDPAQRAVLEALHGDLDDLLIRYVEVVNECVGHRRSDTIAGLHICRGNARSTWFASGGYDAIAPIVFARTEVDRLLLEYDDERSGSFEALRLVPADTTVVLGLVTTKHGELESIDHLRQRITAAAELVPLDRLALSPQCGFASVAEGNLLTEDDQWRKLELVVEASEQMGD